MTAMSFGIRVACFFAAWFLALGIYLPFFPVWLKAQNLSDTEVALVLATPLVRIVAGPALSFLADRFNDRRLAVAVLGACTLAGFAALSAADGFLSIFLICLIIAVFWNSILPIADTIAVAGSQDFGLDYGRMRLWGSLAFIGGSLGAGVVLTRMAAEAVLWMLIGVQVLVVLCALALPRAGTQAATAGDRPEALRPAELAPLFRNAVFPAFLIAAALTQATHAMYYAVGAIHWRSLGIGDMSIGILWSIGVIAEVVLFAFSGRAVARLAPAGLLLAGAAAGIVRWSIMAFDPGVAVLAAVQVLHAATFGASHLGVMHFIGRSAPRRMQATAMGVYSALSAGILLPGFIALSGPLYHARPGLAYLAMAGIAAAAFGTGLFLKAKPPPEEPVRHDRIPP